MKSWMTAATSDTSGAALISQYAVCTTQLEVSPPPPLLPRRSILSYVWSSSCRADDRKVVKTVKDCGCYVHEEPSNAMHHLDTPVEGQNRFITTATDKKTASETPLLTDFLFLSRPKTKCEDLKKYIYFLPFLEMCVCVLYPLLMLF